MGPASWLICFCFFCAESEFKLRTHMSTNYLVEWKQRQVFIIQSICHFFTIITYHTHKLCSLFFCHFKIILAQTVTGTVIRQLIRIIISINFHLPTRTNNVTPSLELPAFCVLDTVSHSGSGQAWLIKVFPKVLSPRLGENDISTMRQVGVDFKARACCSSRQEGLSPAPL